MIDINTLTASTASVTNGDLVSIYLKEIGRFPLLTVEQEINYGKAVQMKMNLHSSKQSLTAKLQREPTLLEWAKEAGEQTPEQLNQKIRAGEIAKRKMIEGNLRLVVSVAKKYRDRGLDFLDLIQEGSLGLQQAVEKFDPYQGYKLSTYAHWWIKQGITRALANHSRTIRLPVHLNERLSKIKRTRQELSQRLGRSPSIFEISQEIHLKVEQIQECFEVSRGVRSLSQMCGDEKESELETLLPALQPSPLDLTSLELSRHSVLELLQQLKPLQREIITLRYGLFTSRSFSIKEIATKFNRSPQTIRQGEERALKNLKQLCQPSDCWDWEILSISSH